MRKPKPYWSECLVTKIKKEQKNCWKHLNMLREIGLPIWNSQNRSMFPLAFDAGWLQGHWWGFISRNYVVWPTFLLMNVFIALKGSHFWFLFYKVWKFYVFPCFYNIVLKQLFSSAFLITNACIAVWCLPTCLHTQFWKNILPGYSAQAKHLSLTSQSRCTTLQQLNNLIHHKLVYNFRLLFSFAIWFSVELKQP